MGVILVVMTGVGKRLLLLVGAATVGGCGALTVHALPPAAEPARSPALVAAPAGRVFAVGRAPEGIAVDPVSGRVAVALRDPPALALLDGASGRVVRRVGLPGAPRHLSIARGGAPFVVPAETADRLLLVSARGSVVADVAVGARPHDAVTASGQLFVGDERANAVTVVSAGRRARVLRTLRVAVQPGGLSAAAGGRDVAVVSVRERVLELYDARTLRRLARVGAGIGPTHVAADATGGRLYVTDTQGGALLVFHVRPRLELVRREYLPGAPYGIALDPARQRLWVTLTARNQLVELPAHGRPHPLRRLPTVRQPDTVAVDPRTGRVFVTGRDAGVVEAIDP